MISLYPIIMLNVFGALEVLFPILLLYFLYRYKTYKFSSIICGLALYFIIAYMISNDARDLAVFMKYVDSLEKSDELIEQIEQNRVQVLQYQQQKAQMETMRNQAMWNTLFAQQQQQFAAMDRISSAIHQDLDSFHNNLNQQMAQNDRRFNAGQSGAESMDDRIQRMRHESIMDVETYERNDGSTVEYSSYADRVFENNLDTTQHFGTHHYYDDYIPEGWHELKKK